MINLYYSTIKNYKLLRKLDILIYIKIGYASIMMNKYKNSNNYI